MGFSYDFCGWATKNNITCADGRRIMKNAFAHCNNKKVPLVWNHEHGDMHKIIGHALLENRPEGVYAYCSLNDSENGALAKELVQHGDICSLSIFANHLTERGKDVLHGYIREVSLVPAGANPGATIENVVSHSDEDGIQAIMWTGENIVLSHGDIDDDDYYDEEEGEDMDGVSASVDDVIDSMSEEQQDLLYSLVAAAHDAGYETALDDVADSEEEYDDEDYDDYDNEEEDYDDMAHNVFDDSVEFYGDEFDDEFIAHSDLMAAIDDAQSVGSMKQSFIQHGIENIDFLFPDYQTVYDTPDFIKRDTSWVQKVMGAVHHTPFSRIKSVHADITPDEARAKGYIKGNMKIEEVFGLLRRTTDPQTVYKKQKLDRDDVIDITDMDVVAWLKAEMRMMLDEELCRDFLVGDGRLAGAEDHVSPDHIRPIWTDNQLYTINKVIPFPAGASDDAKAKLVIRSAVKARKEYKGSGNPTLFTTEDWLTDMLLIEDNMGRRIYDSEAKLATAMRVKEIVTVPVLENLTRSVDGEVRNLIGIIVNLADYNVGADKGGSVNMFDDFDIDYNAQKYLIETRCSGALTKPFSAIALEYTTNFSQKVVVKGEASSTTVLGKAVSELQKDVIVADDIIYGTLPYVTGFTQFSGDPNEQHGNYMVLHFYDEPVGATTTVELIGGTSGPKELDSDRICIFRITSTTQQIRVVSTYDGSTYTKTYRLDGVRLIPEN